VPPRFPKEAKVRRDPTLDNGLLLLWPEEAGGREGQVVLYRGPYTKRTDWVCDYCGRSGAVAHAPSESLLNIIRLAVKDHDQKCPRDMLTRKVCYKDDRGRVQEAMRRHHGLESMRLTRPVSSGDLLRPAPALLTRKSRHPDLLLGDTPDGTAD